MGEPRLTDDLSALRDSKIESVRLLVAEVERLRAEVNDLEAVADRYLRMAQHSAAEKDKARAEVERIKRLAGHAYRDDYDGYRNGASDGVIAICEVLGVDMAAIRRSEGGE